MTTIDDTPLRGTGICGSCGHHTNDGAIHLIESGSRPGGRVLVCADFIVCRKRQKDRREAAIRRLVVPIRTTGPPSVADPSGALFVHPISRE
ncbi:MULTISPECIES: hypothetical protein [unclassified Streptomyces]|uniref:hypothetical protein n=1 Tax=unclassified Streptomyces TaxID=2593676 RepID=UPI00382182B6